MRKPPELVEPDERWQSMVGDRAALAELAGSWPSDERVRPAVGEMLRVSRQLFVHSYFVHEFAVVAVVWSVFALEAALRDCLGGEAGERDGLARLVGKAERRNWLSSAQAEAIRAGAELRNRLVHTEGQKAFTVGMTAELLAASHQAVSDIYRAAVTR